MQTESVSRFLFFNDTATTEIYTLSLHDALPICRQAPLGWDTGNPEPVGRAVVSLLSDWWPATTGELIHVDGGYHAMGADRKSTRLNSSHANISYAVFCLKKKITREAYYFLTLKT